jgi:hypothetical protein
VDQKNKYACFICDDHLCYLINFILVNRKKVFYA